MPIGLERLGWTLRTRRDWAARLPFEVALGPYRLAVEWRDNAHMLDRRRRACINLEAGRLELRQDLAGLALARAFFGCLIRLSHYRGGCQSGCVEEAYAHSFATGMVEFALRNPRAWLWFNLLLSKSLPGAPGFDRAVRGALPRPPALPPKLRVAGRDVQLRCISRARTGNAYGWYHYERREVQLYAGLAGTNLPVVALHEITHAVHHAFGLEPGESHGRYTRAQLDGWLGIMRRSPDAWRWLAWTMSFPAEGRLPLQPS